MQNDLMPLVDERARSGTAQSVCAAGNEDVSHGLVVLWAQQRFDRATFVHRAIALGDLLERQPQVEHFARVDLPGEDQIDQLWQISPNGRRTAEQTDVPEEEVRAVERDTVRHADVADR